MKGNDIHRPLILCVLNTLREKRTVSYQEQAEITALAETLDDEYGALRIAFEERGEGTAAGWDRAFQRARAVAAVAYAAEDHTTSGIGGVIAEATAAVRDVSSLKSKIASILACCTVTRRR